MVCMCMMYVCTCVIGCVQHLLSLVQCHTHCTISYIHMCEGVEVWWGRVWEVRSAWLCSSVTCLLACMLQSSSRAKASQSTVPSPVPHPLPQAPSRPLPQARVREHRLRPDTAPAFMEDGALLESVANQSTGGGQLMHSKSSLMSFVYK